MHAELLWQQAPESLGLAAGSPPSATAPQTKFVITGKALSTQLQLNDPRHANINFNSNFCPQFGEIIYVIKFDL